MSSAYQTSERNLAGRTTAAPPWLVDGLGRDLPRPIDWPALPALRDMLRSEIAAQLHDLAVPCPEHGTRVEVRCPACVQFGNTLQCAAVAAGDSTTMPALPTAGSVEAYDRHVTNDGQPRQSLLARARNRLRRTP
ncbi:hypothetical protein ACGFJC_47115 [Nonomuraea fuscirosea]|uniref:hypothetical protein n=1 Tax=Nonomuraea fuscirosea TaxID=1291556 RepID=UPI003713D4C9